MSLYNSMAENPMVVDSYWRQRTLTPQDPVDINLMIRQLTDMSNDLEQMVADLKPRYEWDTDEDMHHQMLELGRINSRIIEVIDVMRMEVR